MNPNVSTLKPRILVAPLDWGLGHATRCIPIIHQLINNNCEVLLAAEGKIKSLLEAEFPHPLFLELKGYNIQFGKTGWEVFGKLLLQIPKIIEAIDEEHNWLNNVVDEYEIDAVISDNRYGLFNERIYSVFITHQLLIKTSLGNAADKLFQKLNYEYVNAYNECWVPDVEEENNLSGDLSHPEKMPDIPVHYIGALSRFIDNDEKKSEDHLLIMLSGPEPQRTILEDQLLEQLKQYKKQVFFVRGLPGNTDLPTVSENVITKNHLPAAELQQAIISASFIVSRCGYSTIMDIMSLKKRSILIPTPGQTEQEYLADHLMHGNLALCIPQSKFKLLNALQLADSFNYKFGQFKKEQDLKRIIEELLNTLKQKQAEKKYKPEHSSNL